MRYDPKNDNIGAFRIGDAEPTGNRDKGRQRLEPFKKKSRNPLNDVKLPLSMEEDLRRRAIKTLKQAGLTERQAISSLNETAKQLQAKNRFPSIRKILVARGVPSAEIDRIVNNVSKALTSIEADISAILRKNISPMHTERATPAFGTPLSDAILKGNGAGSISIDADKFRINYPDLTPTKSAIVQSASRSHRPNKAPVVVQVLNYRDIDASIKKAVMGKHKVTLESLGIHPAKNDAEAVDNQKRFGMPKKEYEDMIDGPNINLGYCVLGEVNWDSAVPEGYDKMIPAGTPIQVKFDGDFSQVRPQGEPLTKSEAVSKSLETVEDFVKAFRSGDYTYLNPAFMTDAQLLNYHQAKREFENNNIIRATKPDHYKPSHVLPTTDGIHPYAKSYTRGFPVIQVNDEAHMVKSGHVRPKMQDIRDALNMKPKKQVPR